VLWKLRDAGAKVNIRGGETVRLTETITVGAAGDDRVRVPV
jgi:hypothetical protein